MVHSANSSAKFSGGHVASPVTDRIVVVSMVRNEIDIIDAFLHHNLRLVDALYVADHGSTDGTREALERFASPDIARSRPPGDVRIFDYRTKIYLQREVCGFLARKAFAHDAAWVIFLDADEFLPYATKRELLMSLSAGDSPVVAFAWQNLTPSRPTQEGEPFTLAQPYFTQNIRRHAPRTKIALNSDFFVRYPRFRLREGNHKVEPAPGLKPVTGSIIGSLIHIPIRSATQARAKVEVTLESTSGQPEAMRQASHLVALKQVLEETNEPIDEAALLAAASSIYEGADTSKVATVDVERLEIPWFAREITGFTRHTPAHQSLPLVLSRVSPQLLPGPRYGRARIVQHGDTLSAVLLRFARIRHILHYSREVFHPRRATGLLRRLQRSLPRS